MNKLQLVIVIGVVALLVGICIAILPLGTIPAVRGILAVQAAPAGTHQEVDTIADSKDTKSKKLSNFCMNADGNLLVCDERSSVVRVITPKDELKATWKMPFKPQAICIRSDGTAIVAGTGKVAIVGKDGKVTKTADIPAASKYSSASGVAAIGDDVFVCAYGGRSGFAVYRFNSKLDDRKEIIKGLRGCCGQQDITSDGKSLYVAECGRHRVVKYDRNGKMIGSFGKRDRAGIEGFGGCCDPKNLRFGPEGDLYTASSTNARVKRYTPDGKFVSVVGSPKYTGGCLRVTIAINKDGSRIYFLDSGKNVIRVLGRKATVAASTDSASADKE
jgi:sugar lactone lactonase YvrE